MMIEKLLEPFIRVIDAELFKAVLFKNLEAGDIKDANKVGVIKPNTCSIELPVDARHQISKTSFISAFGESVYSQSNLLRRLDLFNPFSSGLHPRMQQAFYEWFSWDAQQFAYF